MNLHDVRLEGVILEEIRGTPYEDNGDDAYDARFQVAVLSQVQDLQANDSVEVRVKLQTSQSGETPFFEISMIGKFRLLTPEVAVSIASAGANYELGSLLYPYLRSIAKPVLEAMGANPVDFPFSPPPAPPKKKPATRKKKVQSAP